MKENTEVNIEITPSKAKDKISRSLFGIWKDRLEFQDSTKWVEELRNHEW